MDALLCKNTVLKNIPPYSPGSFYFFFNWRIMAIQYCVGLRHTSTWISHGHTHAPSLLKPLLSPAPSHPSRLSQSTGSGSPHQTANPHLLSLTDADVFSHVLLSVWPTLSFSQVTAALSTISRTWKQPKCQLADEWIQKFWVHIYNGMLLNYKKEHTWVSPNGVDEHRAYYTEWSQKEKDKYCILTYTYKSRKMVLRTYLQGSSGAGDIGCFFF